MAKLFDSILRRNRARSRTATGSRDLIADELRKRRSRDALALRCDAAAAEPPRSPEALVARGPVAIDVTGRPTPVVSGRHGETIPEELMRGVEPSVLRLLTPQLAHEFGVIPVRVDDSWIVLATASEPTLKLQNEIRWLLSLGSDRPRRPKFQRIPAPLLEQCLDVYYPYSGHGALLPAPAELLRLFAPTAGDDADVLRPAAAGRATVRSLVNGILMKAVFRGASDVLFECFETEFRVRFKVEGACEYAMAPLPPSAAPQVVSVVKQHARLDIAETERSQDGRFDMKVEYKGEIKSIQFRVAVRPTINGEGCVIRLHDNSERRPRLETVGADLRTLDALERVRDHRGGLVVFCGPTGSGKTTTLAAILGECDSTRENIITIEDPVEIRLPGVTQSAVNEAKGETFARMLRTTLRVAPDRILVGEVRDHETAHLVVKASLTGHQVLTTVHSEDAPKAITRMLEEGISPFNLSSVLFLVVAQRLLNRICEHCAVDVEYSPEVLLREQFSPRELGEIRAREGRGCSMCHQRGTFGRVAIFETLVVTDAIRDLVARRPHDLEALVRREAIAGGLRPLRRGGLDLVRAGAVALHQVADATPYIPDEALPLVWAESRAAWSAEAARRAGGPERIRAIELGDGDGLEGADDETPPHTPPSGFHADPAILLGPERESDDGLRFRDGGFELLQSLADQSAAAARATLSGSDELGEERAR
jgi:type IV pilus assembly protein PilB